MTELETQVIKIQLGDNRQASSFVYTLAETIDSAGTELYVICELPMFNPAANEECQKIAETITASLKRSYRRSTNPNIFENALANINDELSKLVTLGKTHWLGKLNAVVAMKRKNILSVSTVGKISALLYRDNNFVSIADSPTSNHQPLKTFEQFSEGKLRLGDLFLLSTPQLLNHISIDRIKSLIDHNDLPIAAQSIIEYLKADLGPEIACGTIFAMQVEPGTISEEEVDLEQYLIGPQIKSEHKKSRWLPGNTAEAWSTTKIIGANFIQDLKQKYLKKQYWRGLVDKSSQSIGVVQSTFRKTAQKLQPNNITHYSRQKKFFFISAIILILVLVTNITIAKIRNTNTEQLTLINDSFTKIEKLLNDTSAALLYNDELQAENLYSQAQNLLNNIDQEKLNEEQLTKNHELTTQAQELENKLNKISNVQVTNLGSLGNSNHLIDLPDYLATEVNRTIIAYQKSTGQFLDNTLRASEPILDSIALKNNMAAIFTGKELYIWDVTNNIITGGYNQDLPNNVSFGGIKTYPTNNKVYILDTFKGVIISLNTTNRNVTSPTVSVRDNSLNNASDFAIDGSIYVASSGTIVKFNSGTKQDFPTTINNLSSQSKLYTQTDFNRLYVLDPGNDRVIILEKSGALFKTFTSEKFTNLKDFAVDEKTKTIYLLNDTDLYKFNF